MQFIEKICLHFFLLSSFIHSLMSSSIMLVTFFLKLVSILRLHIFRRMIQIIFFLYCNTHDFMVAVTYAYTKIEEQLNPRKAIKKNTVNEMKRSLRSKGKESKEICQIITTYFSIKKNACFKNALYKRPYRQQKNLSSF